MADEKEDRSREDLSEEASPYRLEEFRRKGQVAQSRELTGIIAVAGASFVLYSMGQKAGFQILDFMKEIFRSDFSSHFDLGSGQNVGIMLKRGLSILVALTLPVCLVAMGSGVLGSFMQIGSIFSFDPLTPDFGKISPLSGIKRLFSGKHLIDSFRLIFKMVVMLAVTYSVIKVQMMHSITLVWNDPGVILNLFGQVGRSVFFPMMGVLALFALGDFALEKWDYGKNLRLTKQESKQEQKEREGDPQIKARVRMIQREIARRRMMAAVKKADVIITNPTHIAVALVYDRDRMAAPKVIAKGADFMAQKIKKVAADAGIPLVENVPLARTLFATVKIGKYVPRNLYQAVAEVLAYVYRLKNPERTE